MGKRKKGVRGRGRGVYGGANRPQNRGPRLAQNNNGGNAQPETAENGEPGPVEPGGGVLELHPNGYGFLRDPTNNYMRELTDPFVPGSMIEKYGLREGVHIKGMVQGPPQPGPQAAGNPGCRRHASRGVQKRQGL